MRTHSFAATGIELPVVGQGTWDVPERGERLREAVAAMRRGVELGMTHIDTAEMYGSGRVEEIVGDAIAGFVRERLFLVSKVLPGNASRAGTVAACERSLRRLRTDYLDLYLLHWASANPIEETMEALESLVAAGKVRFIGVSNFDRDELIEARACVRTVPISCNQVLYHLRERGMEQRVLPYCEEHRIAVVGYTPFGRGRFPRHETADDGVLGRIARKHGVSPRAVILTFLTRRPSLFAIPKASRIAHVEENARGGSFTLESEDVAAIDAAFPVGPERPLATA